MTVLQVRCDSISWHITPQELKFARCDDKILEDYMPGGWIFTSPGLMILSASEVRLSIDLRLPSSIFFSLNANFLRVLPFISTVSV
jgi:hypothetical protein